MRRVVKLASQLVGSTRADHRSSVVSNSRGLSVNMPILVKASSSESCGFSSMPSLLTASQLLSLSGQPNRVFVNHVFYKGKAALCMVPVAPEFSPLDSGKRQISREGGIILRFAPAIGQRQYDWKRRQVFCLSVTEIGSLLSLSPNESCEFFHDSFKGTSNAGRVAKVLQITPFPDGSGYFFKLSISNKVENFDDHLIIPITKAEFAVMRTAFNFILPCVIGWHAHANPIKSSQSTCITFGKADMQTSSAANSFRPDQDTSTVLGTSKIQQSSKSDQVASIAFGKSKMQVTSVESSRKSDEVRTNAFGKSKQQANSFNLSKSDQDENFSSDKSETQASSVVKSMKPDPSASFTSGKSETQLSSGSEWDR